MSPLSKKSLHLKSKVNELGKLGFGSYPFHRLPVPLRKILEHLCDSVSSLPNEKKPSEHAGRDGAAETQGFIQQVQLVFPTAAKRASGEEASSERFSFSGTKRFGGKEVILLC